MSLPVWGIYCSRVFLFWSEYLQAAESNPKIIRTVITGYKTVSGGCYTIAHGANKRWLEAAKRRRNVQCAAFICVVHHWNRRVFTKPADFLFYHFAPLLMKRQCKSFLVTGSRPTVIPSGEGDRRREGSNPQPSCWSTLMFSARPAPISSMLLDLIHLL